MKRDPALLSLKRKSHRNSHKQKNVSPYLSLPPKQSQRKAKPLSQNRRKLRNLSLNRNPNRSRSSISITGSATHSQLRQSRVWSWKARRLIDGITPLRQIRTASISKEISQDIFPDTQRMKISRMSGSGQSQEMTAAAGTTSISDTRKSTTSQYEKKASWKRCFFHTQKEDLLE